MSPVNLADIANGLRNLAELTDPAHVARKIALDAHHRQPTRTDDNG